MSNSPHQRDGSASQPRTSTESGVYVPPHISANRNGAGTDHRYSKEHMLQLFKNDESEDETLLDLYVNGFEPTVTNGNSSATWGRREEHKESHAVEACWVHDGHMYPVGLHDLTEEEREVDSIFQSMRMTRTKPPTDFFYFGQLAIEATYHYEQRWHAKGPCASPQVPIAVAEQPCVWPVVANNHPSRQSSS